VVTRQFFSAVCENVGECWWRCEGEGERVEERECVWKWREGVIEKDKERKGFGKRA